MEEQIKTDITNLKINMAELTCDISYIKEKLDNLEEFKKEIRKAVIDKVDRKEFIFWRNTGVAACITVIIQLLFLILNS